MASRNLNETSTSHRSYGAIASTSSSPPISNLPNVSFSGFSPTEFMSLNEGIGHNINAVHSSCKQLETIVKVIGTQRDSQATRAKVHNVNVKTNTRIEAITKDLQRLTALVHRGDKQQRLQLKKLTSDFQTVVEKYSTLQRNIAGTMQRSYTQSQVAVQSDEQVEVERLEQLQRQQQLNDNMEFEQPMLLDRERQMKQVEVDILDVNAIMRTISSLVQAQGEHVDNIETSIENAATEVELGREELAKAAVSRQSYRRKIFILLAIAVIVGLIVTGIIVAKLKS